MASKVTGYRISFPEKPAEISAKAQQLIDQSLKLHNELGNLAEQQLSVENFARKLSDFEGDYQRQRSEIDFIQHTFSDKAMRDMSSEAEKKLSEHEVEISMRKDLFEKFKAIKEKIDCNSETASSEMQRYINHNVRDGKRNGLDLAEDKRNRIKEIMNEMSRIAIDFAKNLSEDTSSLLFSCEELAGLPEDFINSLEKDEQSGKFKVTTKYPHYFPVMKLAKNPSTRQRLEFLYNTRCKDSNIPLLQQLVALRRERAAILNYPTHADYALETRMAKKAKTVQNFLSELSEKLKPLQQAEMRRFLQVKEEDCKANGYEFDGKLNAWDLRYCMNKVEERDYAVDHEKLREYFPIEKVTEGLLNVYQRLLGLKFTRVDEVWKWHEDVQTYRVEDSASGELLGFFHLDLYPRDGKYGHAACFSLQPGCMIGAERQVAVAALVCNFTKPTADKPSLLTHDEVETIFHEFGHGMHAICAKAECSQFSGTSVERDFVEAPSQMLEHWVWSEKSLAMMSGHYKSGEKIPDDLLKSLINSRQANTGYFNQRQITLATFDQNIHTSSEPSIDVIAEYNAVSEKIVGIRPTEGTAFAANFTHLAAGYDAQYYSYLWSDVFAADMFCSQFGEDKVLDEEVGMRYRKYILQPGGSRDAADMLRDFLGREPKFDSFLKLKGL